MLDVVGLGIAVYDAEWHEIKTQAELSLERVPGLIARKICGLNKTLRIPAHSCGPLQDSGDVKVNLGQERDMPVGNYFVTEKGQIRPQRGIRITIVNQELKH